MTPGFLGRDQDHLIALADETAGVTIDIAEQLTEPLYDFKDDIEGPGGAELVGILDNGGYFTGDNVEDALQELGAGVGAVVIDSIADSDTTHAPSRNAVFDALALKADGTGTANGTNTGDQTSIVGITGSLAEFNTALTGADFATGGGTATGTNTGDQTLGDLGGQPLDATLTALAAQNWVSNAIPIGTGADTVAQLAITANTFPGRSSSGNIVAKPISDFMYTVLDDASSTIARATLGAQEADVTLTALAGTAWALNSLPIGSGADTVAQTPFAINTFPARASTGNMEAKAITDAALAALANMTVVTAFTPTIVGSAVAGVGTYTSQSGVYVRFGNLVFFKLTVGISAHTGSGTTRIVLPLTSANDSINCPVIIGIIDNFTTGATTQIAADVLSNSAHARLLGIPIGGGTTAGQTLDTAFAVQLAGFYFV